MRFIYIAALAISALSFQHQPSATGKPAPGTGKNTVEDLTVTYTIELSKSRNKSIGMGESYNGGTKTLFVSNGLVRLRLVSLMRMQSIFLLPAGNEQRTAAIVKESGKNKHKIYLSASEWKQYNAKYNGASCIFPEDTAIVAGYACKKAIITLTDGRTITAFYTRDIQRVELSTIEPVFTCIPGLVLKYTYEYNKGKITYIATAVSRKQIDQAILKVPAKGFTELPYQPSVSERDN